MEFSGDEKRIQALFSELSLENQTRTPRFEKLWQGAEANAPARAPLAMRLVLVTIVVIVVMSLVAARSWFSSTQTQHAAHIPPQVIPTTSAPRVQQHAKREEYAELRKEEVSYLAIEERGFGAIC